MPPLLRGLLLAALAIPAALQVAPATTATDAGPSYPDLAARPVTAPSGPHRNTAPLLPPNIGRPDATSGTSITVTVRPPHGRG